MGDAEEFDLEDPQRDTLARVDPMHPRPADEAVLLQFVAQQPQGQAGAVDRRIAQPLQQEGDGADMVFVAVGQDQGADVAGAAVESRDVGEDQIDPEHVGLGEHQAAVDDEDFAAALQGHQVQADLPQPPQGEEADGIGMQRLGGRRGRQGFSGHDSPPVGSPRAAAIGVRTACMMASRS